MNDQRVEPGTKMKTIIDLSSTFALHGHAFRNVLIRLARLDRDSKLAQRGSAPARAGACPETGQEYTVTREIDFRPPSTMNQERRSHSPIMISR